MESVLIVLLVSRVFAIWTSHASAMTFSRRSSKTAWSETLYTTDQMWPALWGATCVICSYSEASTLLDHVCATLLFTVDFPSHAEKPFCFLKWLSWRLSLSIFGLSNRYSGHFTGLWCALFGQHCFQSWYHYTFVSVSPVITNHRLWEMKNVASRLFIGGRLSKAKQVGQTISLFKYGDGNTRDGRSYIWFGSVDIEKSVENHAVLGKSLSGLPL